MTHSRVLLQMFLTAGFAAVAAALVIYAAVQVQFEKALFEKARSSLESKMVFAKVIARDFIKGGELISQASWRTDMANSETRFSIIKLDGEVIFDSSRPVEELDNHRDLRVS